MLIRKSNNVITYNTKIKCRFVESSLMLIIAAKALSESKIADIKITSIDTPLSTEEKKVTNRLPPMVNKMIDNILVNTVFSEALSFKLHTSF